MATRTISGIEWLEIPAGWITLIDDVEFIAMRRSRNGFRLTSQSQPFADVRGQICGALGEVTERLKLHLESERKARRDAPSKTQAARLLEAVDEFTRTRSAHAERMMSERAEDLRHALRRETEGN